MRYCDPQTTSLQLVATVPLSDHRRINQAIGLISDSDTIAEVRPAVKNHFTTRN